MSVLAGAEFTPGQRRIALAWGTVCHLSFAVAVTAMMAGLYTGMSYGLGPLRGAAALVADIALIAQFPIVHSLLLSKRGRAWLARLAPLGLGSALGTTTYATIASWQLLLTFVLWSPMDDRVWAPEGPMLVAMSLVYAAAWAVLLKTMVDAGLEVQTGYLGWGSVFRGRRPVFREFEPRGTFRWVRQPIYVAFAATLWSAPIWTFDRLLLAIAWTSYCLIAPLHKERRYRAAYGARFERYRSLVPYWVPRRSPADLDELREGTLREATLLEEMQCRPPARGECTAGLGTDLSRTRPLEYR